jgi:hypothetical protein
LIGELILALSNEKAVAARPEARIRNFVSFTIVAVSGYLAIVLVQQWLYWFQTRSSTTAMFNTPAWVGFYSSLLLHCLGIKRDYHYI